MNERQERKTNVKLYAIYALHMRCGAHEIAPNALTEDSIITRDFSMIETTIIDHAIGNVWQRHQPANKWSPLEADG
jgi:hypothetical protein